MSQLLYEFLKDWLRWAEGKSFNKYEYDQCMGLCSNSRLFFLKRRNIPDKEYLHREMAELFRREGLDEEYPFMTRSEYFYEDNHHKHPVRLAWVRDHIAQYEKEHQ